MKLSIITITYNNLEGLRRTVRSVLAQNYRNWELIVVDGGSTDGTKDWLQETADSLNSKEETIFRFVSEPDKGIYNAQNKGIAMAKGEYCYFLNAGDELCGDYVLEKMLLGTNTDIVYGNEIEVYNKDGKVVRKSRVRGVENPTMLDLYQSCMKHQATIIRRSLFDRYGVYDESLKMCADWEWFWRVIGFHNDVTLAYKNIDVALFEAGGFSYTHPEIDREETEIVRDRYMPSHRMQADYDFFCRYERLRDAEQVPILRFGLKTIMWCIKHIRRRK